MANAWEAAPIVEGNAAAPPPAWQSAPVVDDAGEPAGKSGYLANTAAGVVEGSAGALNVLSDPFGNLVGKPLATVGMFAHDALAPVFGYDRFTPEFRSAMLDDTVPQPGTRIAAATGKAMGAPATEDVHPATAGQSLVRSVVPAAVGMAALGGGSGILRSAVINPALGVSGELGGETASAFVPDWAKPAAGLVGNVAGMAAPNALAHLGGGVFAKSNTLLDDQGVPVVSRATGQPLTATPAQARAAGEQLNAAATDPAAVRAALDNPPAPLMEGDQPTTAKLTGDPGLNAAEFTASRTGTDQQKGAFTRQANQQNDARVKVIQSQAAEGDVPTADAALKAHAEAADTAQAARVAGVQTGAAADVAAAQAAGEGRVGGLAQTADTARASVGGDLPAGSDAAVGAALRDPIAAANQAAKAREGALWDAIDPHGTLAVDMAPVKGGAAGILREMSPNAAPLAGNEAGIFSTAADLPDVQSFRDLAALRSRITDAIRQERGPQGDPQAVRRMSMLLGHVNETMAGAAAETPPPTATVATPAPPGGGSSGAPATGTRAYTPSGQAVDVRYRVREASDLIPSQMPDGRANPAFPAELQPRDRTRAASQQQVNSIANKLNPELLGASASTAEGAPIVGSDGVVESGNGRTMAIQKAYAESSPQAEAYRQWIASQGHDVSGMKAPVLVRERLTPMDMPARAKFADDAGASPVLSMSAAERAGADSKRLPGDTLSLYRGGEVTSRANGDFVRAFASHVVPEGEHASFMTSDGELSVEGAARMRNALAQRAYGSNSLVSALAEHADDNIKAFGGALLDASGDMAKLRGAMEAGTVGKSADLAPDLIEAAGLIQTAKRAGVSLADAVAQRDAFTQRGERVETILRAAFGDDLRGRMSRAKFADLLTYYSENAQVQSGLFGANETTGEMFANARARYGYGTGTSSRRGAGISVGDGQSVGLDGNQAQRPVDGPPGQANAGPPTANPATAAVPAQAPLTPNFDASAQARYAAARQATADRAATFKNPPGVGQALQGGSQADSFKTPDSAVPNIIVKVGPAGADVAKAYLAAGGDPTALSDAAAYSLRQYAARADGTLDPGRVGTWAKDRASFLSQLPESADKFSAAADAQRAVEAGTKDAALALKQATATAQAAVDGAMATRASAAKAMQASAVGKFLGQSDPVATMWSVLNDKKNGQANARLLAETVKGNPDATLGLQRTVAAAIDREIVGNSRGPTSEEGGIRAEKFQNLIKSGGPALAEILTPEQMRGVMAAHDTMVRDYRSGQVGFGSATGQIQSGNARGVVGKVANVVAGMASGGSIGGAIGGWLAGGTGAFIGSTIGIAAAKVIQQAREAGIQNVADLRTEALLNPALYRLLTAKITPQNQTSLLASVATQLGRMSLVSAVSGQQDQRRMPTPPRNALLH